MATSIKFTQATVTVSVANKAYQLSATPIKVPWFEIYIPSGNSTSVFLGGSDVTTSNQIPRSTNTTYSFSASERGDFDKGDYFNLSELYVTTATAGDTVIISYPVRT